MKIFTTKQISIIDQYTIKNEPIASIDLMERASEQLCKYVLKHFPKTQSFAICCGFGNNGGDGLALARMLYQHNYRVRVLHFNNKEKQSPDNITNYNRCKELGIQIIESVNAHDYQFDKDEIIIDALFGSGLKSPLEGLIVSIIQKINESGCKVIAIDIPSGLMGEDNRTNNTSNIIKAHITLTLEFPKLSFFFPENEPYVGKWEIVPIFLHPDAKEKEHSNYFFITSSFLRSIFKIRPKFAEKREVGHGLLYAGSKGKMGAAVLAAKAAIRSGAGLISVWIPESERFIIQSTVPEILLKTYKEEDHTYEYDFHIFNAIAAGCAIGTDSKAFDKIQILLSNPQKPLVLDADALTLISKYKDMLNQLSPNTILTPHIREFDRLFGQHSSHFERFLTAQRIAQEFKLIIILKGAYTQIHLPEGTTYFNSTGNQGMATAGSGDVLTGILLGLLAQGYSPQNAAIIGTYIHGLAADYALKKQSYESLIASDIIKYLGKAFKTTFYHF